MTKRFFIGVDGGATKCTVRLQDETGTLLGRANSGPANIRLSVDQAWQSIYAALAQLLPSHGLALEDKNACFYAGMGLAGTEIEEAYQAFISHPHPFHTLRVVSDAHTACLGAHDGNDGAIIIAGSGVVGYQIQDQQITKVAGWGFPHDDEGSGAWLGLQAVKMTLQYLDGREASSGLAQAVYAYFKENQANLVAFANQANSTAYAELAPLVIQQSKQGDATAIALLRQAGMAIDKVWAALTAKQTPKPLPCALLGGIAPFLQPYLNSNLLAKLKPCQAPADKGAVWLVKGDFSTP